MTTQLRKLPGIILVGAAIAAISACGPVSGWHVDAYNSTAEALIFRVTSSAPAISWRVNSGESILILKSSSPLIGQIAVLDPNTCTIVASQNLPTNAGIVSAIYARPSVVSLEFAPDPVTVGAVTLPNSADCQ